MRQAAAAMALALVCAAVLPADDVRVIEELDGKHRAVSIAVFAPNGDRVARVAFEDGRSFVIVGGKADPNHYDFIDSLGFSADGKHYVYRARTGGEDDGRWRIVIDGEEEKTYAWAGPPALTPDGSKAAYWATRDGGPPTGLQATGEYFVVFGRKDGKSYSGRSIRPVAPVISPDGKKVAYVAPKSLGIWHVVVGKKVIGKGYSAAEDPAFNTTGKYLVFPATVKARKWAIVNARGKAVGDLYDAVTMPVLGKGKKCVYAARDDDGWLVVHGKKKFRGDYALIEKLAISNDGKRCAFAANVGGRFRGLPGGGTAGPGLLIEGGKSHVVVDGKTVGVYKHVHGPVFGPRGKQVAYGGQSKSSKWRVYCGDVTSDEYGEIRCLRFAKDGKSLSFGTHLGPKYVWVTMKL